MQQFRPLLALALATLTAFTSPPPLADEQALRLVQEAVDAMGGEQVLRGLFAVRIAGVRHTNMLEQSERPEGPYIVSYGEFEQRRDMARSRLTTTATARSIVGPPAGTAMTTIVADGVAVMRFGDRVFPAAGDAVVEAAHALALGPERVLATALAAPDLRSEGTRSLQGVAQEVVSFSWGGTRARLYLNRFTSLPTAVEWIADYPFGLWASWGDVTTRLEFSLWHLEAGGLMYPRQWSEFRNDLPLRDSTILEFEANPEPAGEPLEITAELLAGFEARKATAPDRVRLGVDFRGNAQEPDEIAPGLVQIQGMWNVALIAQPEGIFILEAPISSEYSAQVIEKAKELFPGRPILGVISTSDAWPHHGGVREFVANEIPVHALDLTLPLLQRVLEAPRTQRPDSLAKSPQYARLVGVSEPTEIGSGVNRMTIIPIRGEGGERMLAIYFAAHRLLYASDLIQRGSQGVGFFMPSYLAEVEAMVARHELEVESVFAMHLGLTPWSEIEAALATIRGAS